MKKKILFSIIIFIISLCLYILTTKAMPGNIDSRSKFLVGPFKGDIGAFELSHERSSYATLLALDETGKVDLPMNLADIAAPDAGYYRGKIYSYFPPGAAFFAWPFYILGKYFNLSLFFAYSSISLMGSLALVFFYRICKDIFNLPLWTSVFLVITLGFASPFLNFSITFYQHVPTVFFLMLGFYSAWRFKLNTRLDFVWGALAWGCYGAASFYDYPNLLILFPLLIYLVLSGVDFSQVRNRFKMNIRTSLIVSSAVLMLLGGSHLYYNYINFGNVKRFSNTLPKFDPRVETQTLEALQKQDIETITAKKEEITSSLRENRIVNGLSVLFIDIDKSLLLHMPIYLLSIFGLFMARRRLTAEHTTLIAISLINILIYSTFHDPWGGWGYGPRYLLPSLPVFLLFVGIWLSYPGRLIFIKKVISYLLFAFGAGVALLGAVGVNYLVPGIEAVYLDLPNLPNKFWSNFRFLDSGINGTFIYNTYLKNQLTLWEYYYILFGVVLALGFIALFIIPLFEKKEEQ